jgi:NAD(P)-dependent dehydrogenase (short-subunit alcohol dehydrogenase family)
MDRTPTGSRWYHSVRERAHRQRGVSAGRPLEGAVALVAGATRGASRATAVELARAGAFVYATGRSSRADGPSEIGRPETIDDTGDLIAAVGRGRAVRVDHLEPDEVRDLVATVERDHGRLDVLVNGIFGGDAYLRFGATLWEHDLRGGLRMLRMGIDTHAITSHFALPLVIRRRGGLVVELTDGTSEYNRAYRADVGMFYDLVKAAVERMTLAQAHELAPHGATAIAVTPGWMRSEAMLEAFGVTEATWLDACADQPHFCISESPTYTGRTVAALAADPDRAGLAGRVTSSGALARHYGVTDTDGTQPDCWRYLVEVRDAGLPADDTGYR